MTPTMQKHPILLCSLVALSLPVTSKLTRNRQLVVFQKVASNGNDSINELQL